MKAAVLTQPRQLEIVTVDESPLEPHEVLVKTMTAGICGTDHAIYEGRNVRPYPFIPGHESAGVIEGVGDQVSAVKPGDHVVTCVSVFCGHCEYCLTGRPALCLKQDVTRRPGTTPRLSRDGREVNQMSAVGAWSEHLIVHENALVVIDPDVPFDLAALLGCAVTTGLGAVFHAAEVHMGAQVAVIGCGGIGLNIIQGARIAGATKIVAIDVDPAKLEVAAKLGATDVLTASDDQADRVVEMTRGGVEYSFEAIGTANTARDAFLMLRPGGLGTLVGVLRGQTLELPGGHFASDRRLQGTYMGSNRFRLDIPRYLDLWRDGRLQLEELVSARIGLADLPAVLEQDRRAGAVRTLIGFES